MSQGPFESVASRPEGQTEAEDNHHESGSNGHESNYKAMNQIFSFGRPYGKHGWTL